MGPLVYYCRWQGAKLRLRGRDDRFVWGQLVFSEGEKERIEPFRFDGFTFELTIGEEPDQRRLRLDDMGVSSPIEE
ncbi:MAG: hypothetical protein KJ046_02380 [Anaerolineae bacterium]|nr:hypothetical protein [Anaerolineae bacterium]RIK24456.1 MAG: hypothetical protein DCC51_00075 [Anaerolineae bacterium]